MSRACAGELDYDTFRDTTATLFENLCEAGEFESWDNVAEQHVEQAFHEALLTIPGVITMVGDGFDVWDE